MKKVILLSLLALITFSSCDDINPFSAGGIFPGGNKIIYNVGDQIWKCNLDGSDNIMIHTAPGGIYELEADPVASRIYYLVDTKNATRPTAIISCKLDGSDEQTHITENGTNDLGFAMAIDPFSQVIYYSESGGNVISYSIPDESILKSVTPAATNAEAMDFSKGVLYLYIETKIIKFSSDLVTLSSVPMAGSYADMSVNSKSGSFYGAAGLNMIKNYDMGNPLYTGTSTISSLSVDSLTGDIYFLEDTPPPILYKIKADGSGKQKILSLSTSNDITLLY